MIKKFLLLSTLCLAFSNNNQASQLKMPSLPISKTRAALGLAGLGIAYFGHFLWYDNAFTVPRFKIEKRKRVIDEQHDAANGLRSVIRERLLHDFSGNNVCVKKTFDCIKKTFNIELDTPKKLMGYYIEPRLITFGFTQDNVKIANSLKKIREHILQTEQDNKTKQKSFEKHNCGEPHMRSCEVVRTNAKIIDHELEKMSTKFEHAKNELSAKQETLELSKRMHDKKVTTIKKWTTRLALCGVALFGATRLFSWYRNK